MRNPHAVFSNDLIIRFENVPLWKMPSEIFFETQFVPEHLHFQLVPPYHQLAPKVPLQVTNDAFDISM